MTNTNPTTSEARLTEAFHLVFDVKDERAVFAGGLLATKQGQESFWQAAQVISGLRTLMEMLDIEVPRRFDGQGRLDGAK